MRERSWAIILGAATMTFLSVGLGTFGCGPGRQVETLPAVKPVSTNPEGQASRRAPTSTALPGATNAPETIVPLSDTFWKDLVIADFSAVHAPVNGSANEHLIFGNIAVSPPKEDLPPELVAFLGRWEGYDLSPPAKKDNKGVLVVQQINPQGGKAFLWAGSMLQYPFWVKDVTFRVVPGAFPSIEWQGDLEGAAGGGGGMGTFTFSYDQDQDLLRGGIKGPPADTIVRPIEFSRSQSFYVYRNYGEHFMSKRIYTKEFQQAELQQYGWGYLVYLPEGYEEEAERTWPLILFLCGSGERGDDIFLFAKHGPLRTVREQGALPFLIVAPMLKESDAFRSFPEDYLDGVLNLALAEYRVDRKRIYLTGLSMGGEATYRFALYRPETFAAIAPIAAFNAEYLPGGVEEGFQPFSLPMERIKDLPVWAIHGADDPVIPLFAAQRTVDALRNAGVNVRFTVLEDHEHDAWTDTYSDPAFYEWLLQHRKP
jgi:dienelactone hydrolase